MSLIIVRDPVDLQLFCDEAGTAAVAADGWFVTAAAAFSGDVGSRGLRWAKWLEDRCLVGVKGRKWEKRRGASIWSELSQFLIAFDIHPIIGMSSATAT